MARPSAPFRLPLPIRRFRGRMELRKARSPSPPNPNLALSRAALVGASLDPTAATPISATALRRVDTPAKTRFSRVSPESLCLPDSQARFRLQQPEGHRLPLAKKLRRMPRAVTVLPKGPNDVYKHAVQGIPGNHRPTSTSLADDAKARAPLAAAHVERQRWTARAKEPRAKDLTQSRPTAVERVG